MTPLLYRNMTVISNQLSEELRLTFREGHPGLPHVRVLRVLIHIRPRSRTYVTKALVDGPRISALISLISAIPRHSLLRFEYATMIPELKLEKNLTSNKLRANGHVANGLDYLVRMRQQNLENYQYHSLAWRDRVHVPPATDELANIRCLQIHIVELYDLELAGKIISKARHITSLSVRVHRSLKHLAPRSSFYKDPMRREAENFFNNLLCSGDDTDQHLKLRSLWLEGVAMSYMEDILSKPGVFRDLKHL